MTPFITAGILAPLSVEFLNVRMILTVVILQTHINTGFKLCLLQYYVFYFKPAGYTF